MTSPIEKLNAASITHLHPHPSGSKLLNKHSVISNSSGNQGRSPQDIAMTHTPSFQIRQTPPGPIKWRLAADGPRNELQGGICNRINFLWGAAHIAQRYLSPPYGLNHMLNFKLPRRHSSLDPHPHLILSERRLRRAHATRTNPWIVIGIGGLCAVSYPQPHPKALTQMNGFNL